MTRSCCAVLVEKRTCVHWSSGHTMISTVHFASGGCRPPPPITSRHERTDDIEGADLFLKKKKAGRLSTEPTLRSPQRNRQHHQMTFARGDHSHTTISDQRRVFGFTQSMREIAWATHESEWSVRASAVSHSNGRRNGTRQRYLQPCARAEIFSFKHDDAKKRKGKGSGTRDR